jgi:hypothetical protein
MICETARHGRGIGSATLKYGMASQKIINRPRQAAGKNHE